VPRMAVFGICLCLALFNRALRASGESDTEKSRTAAESQRQSAAVVAAQNERAQALSTQFQSQTSRSVVEATTAATSEASLSAMPDLRSVGQNAVVLMKITMQGKDLYFFDLPNLPSDVTATYRTNSESEELLQVANGRLIRSNVPLSLGEDFTFLEVQYMWCGPNDNDKNRKSCSDDERKTDNYPIELCPPPTKGKNADDTRWPTCTIDGIYTRDLYAEVDNFTSDQAISLIPAFALSQKQFLIANELFERIMNPPADFPTFTINTVVVQDFLDRYRASMQKLGSVSPQDRWTASFQDRSGWSSVLNYVVERFPAASSCSPYKDSERGVSIALTSPRQARANRAVDNGITLDPPKVYDVYTLRQMLAQTASQLSSLSGFNAASITGALTNLQGVTSSSSFFSAQATTFPSPSIASTVNNPNTVTSTTTPASGTSSTNITATCPTGFAPSIGANNTVTCTAATAGTPNQTTLTTTTIPAGNSNPSAGASTVVTANPLTQQTVTTNPSVTPVIPATPASSAFAAPTNTGLSSSDLLTDQVQLNAQITSLELALQGALSDRFLVSGNKSVGTRQQTTLGFNISIDPPRRYKHALAEVKIWVFPSRKQDQISIVNLLPAAKTYNVAKITSNQKQFGASVAINPVNLGVAGGKTKNRLYLAKDTDTLAVEYNPDNLRPQIEQWPDRGRHWSGSAWYENQVVPDTWPNGAKPIGRSPQEAVGDLVPTVEAWQIVANSCDQDPGPYLLPEQPDKLARPLIFGWQFRPVLGADYVQGGIRSVIAQLALPVGLGAQYSPRIFIQTRWRDYNEKQQVVGGVYPGTCSVQEETDPIQVVSPLRVHSVEVDDMTGGILKVVADGNFLSNSFSVISGQATLGPTTFDGKKIQFFGSAEGLLATDDLNLEAEDGQLTPVGMQPILARGDDKDACGITHAYLRATPRPDGNSVVEAIIRSGDRFKLREDGEPKPLFLIGSQVYGLHEAPFLEPSRGACRPSNGESGFTCAYHFLAPTDSLRFAESYTVRDLAWAGMKKSGKVEFDPSFTALTLLASSPAPTANPNAPPDNANPSPASSSSSPKVAPPSLPPVYTLTGNDLMQLWSINKWTCGYRTRNCLDVYQGLTPVPLSLANFQVASKTTAVLSVDPPLPAPFITFSAAVTCKATPKPPGPGPAPAPAPMPGGPAPPAPPPAPAPAPKPVPPAAGAPPAPAPLPVHKPAAPVQATAGVCTPHPDQITITDTNSSANIFYSTDGTSPDKTLALPSTKVYDKPFSLAHGAHAEEINAIAVSPGQVVSALSTALIVPASGGSHRAIATTTATASQLSYKSYRFVWHPVYGEPVEWDLPIPQATAPAVAASAILNESDSTEIIFSNIQIQPNSPSFPISFLFDGQLVVSPVFKYDPVGMTMKVLITSSMTAKPGHKELLLNGYTLASGSVTPTQVQIELPFDVTKR